MVSINVLFYLTCFDNTWCRWLVMLIVLVPSEYFKWTFYPLYFAVLLLTEKPVKVEKYIALAL